MSCVTTSETTSAHASRLHSTPPIRGHFVHLCRFLLRTLKPANVLGSRFEPLQRLQGFFVGKSLFGQQSLLNVVIAYTAHNMVS